MTGRFDKVDLGTDKMMARMLKLGQDNAKSAVREWLEGWDKVVLEAMATQQGPLAEIVKEMITKS